MIKIIINADDCGISYHVNQEIRKCIQDNIISSTTIMANMDDFDGAVKLYQDFHSTVSFGIHFNLTEGCPLLKSQCLLDTGFYIEKNNILSFSGKDFNYKFLTKVMKRDIESELNAQAEKILDSKIIPSHIDSHHHIHWHREIIPIFSKLSNKYGNNKMRKEYFTSNNMKYFELLKANIWQLYAKMSNLNLKTVDDLMTVKDLYKNIDDNKYDQNIITELMVHPGHQQIEYQNEIDLLKNRNLGLIFGDSKLMNYNML